MGFLSNLFKSEGFEELIRTAEKGFHHGVDNATRVRTLQKASRIAERKNDPRKKLIVNAVYLSSKNNGLIR